MPESRKESTLICACGGGLYCHSCAAPVTVSDEMIERGAAALWRDRGYSSPAVRNQLRSQAEAVLRDALEASDDQ